MLADRIVPTLRSWFAAHGQGLVAAYLFGSVAAARNATTATSTSLSFWART